MSSLSLISTVSKEIKYKWGTMSVGKRCTKFFVKPVDHCEGQIATIKQQCKVEVWIGSLALHQRKWQKSEWQG